MIGWETQQDSVRNEEGDIKIQKLTDVHETIRSGVLSGSNSLLCNDAISRCRLTSRRYGLRGSIVPSLE